MGGIRRTSVLLTALLGLYGCTHLDMSRQDAQARVFAWEALRHELSALTEARSFESDRLREDARDWQVLALEMGVQRQENIATSAGLARKAQVSQQAGLRPPPPGMYGGSIPFGYSVLSATSSAKAKVKSEHARRQSTLGNALMNLSDANKQFLRAGGGQENAYILDEAYSVGMWAIGKYTEFLRKRARISTETPRKHLDSQRASLRLRELYGS